MSSARSVGVIYDDKPLVQLRKEDKLANHSFQRNNASEEQPLRQCWGPRNIVALSDKGLKEALISDLGALGQEVDGEQNRYMVKNI